jgi:aspartokinase
LEEKMAERTLVMKFGGTSVGSPDALRGMAEIVRNNRKDWARAVVVVSAMGGVTDLLLAGAAPCRVMNQVKQHLNHCPDCASVFECLLTIIDSAAQPWPCKPSI